MKSRTSFSNLTTFRKNITRFAPVWGLYLIGMLITLVSNGSSEYDRFASNFMPDLISSFGVVNLIYAAVCGVMLFGDLYNTRMCYSLHTIPQKRESLFLSHLAAALCFSLVPNAVASFILMARLQEYWFLALYWLLAVTLQFAFFFGVAALSSMLTGNRFAMLLVYAGLNFVFLLVYWILNTVYLPNMPGVVLNYASFSLLTPVVKLFDWNYFVFDAIKVYNPEFDIYTTFYEYRSLSDGWGYTAILAVLGLVFAGIALILYKLRHLECAGDFVAFQKLKNVACVIMTICVAGVAGLLGEAMGNAMVLWLLVGMVVGFFGSLMLLERRVKVFRKKTFLGFGVLAVILVASFLSTVFDVFGIVQWVPKVSEVESVTLSNYYASDNGYNYDALYSGNRLSIKLTEKEDIEQILTAHRDILDRMDQKNENTRTHRVVLTYTLENGRTVIRNYYTPADGVSYEIVSKYFYTPEQILGFTDWDVYVRNVEYLIVDGNQVPPDLQKKFLNAVRADCENGFIVTDSSLIVENEEPYYWMDIEVRNDNGSYTHRNLIILPGAVNTLALMETPEFTLGYTDWNDYLASVTYIDVSGTELPGEVYPQFLGAMLLDAQNGAISLNGKYAEYTVLIYAQQVDRYLYITEHAENTLAWFREYKENLH